MQGKTFLQKSICHVISVMLMTGCGGGAYQRPVAPIAQSWPAPEGLPGGQSPRQLGWADFFQDPRLRELICQALERNRDLRLAISRIQEARVAYGLAAAERLPNVVLGAYADQEGISQSIAGGRAGVNSQRYDLKLSMISYEADFWGRVASMSDAARARLVGTEASGRVVRATVIAEVANAYYTRLDLLDRVELVREAIITRERSRDLIQQGFEQGAASTLEVLQAEGALQAARGELSSLQTQLATVGNYLTLLTGHAEAELPPGYSLSTQRLDTVFALDVPSEVLLKRPDVMAAEQRLIEAHANVDAARAAFFPRILLTVGMGFASLSLKQLFASSAGGVWSFVPSATLPIFDGGRTSGSLDLAQVRESQAVVDYERTIQLAFREVADLLATQAGLAAQKRMAGATWVIQQQRAIAAEARYKGGAASYLEVLDAMREELAAAQQLSAMRRAELTNAVQLYKALGGGEDVPSHSG